jgi:predicted  nucleic acid-binding Zn-ribbon protein
MGDIMDSREAKNLYSCLDSMIEAINQLQEEIAYIVKQQYEMNKTLKDTSIEFQAMRRSLSYLKPIAESLQNGIRIKK